MEYGGSGRYTILTEWGTAARGGWQETGGTGVCCLYIRSQLLSLGIQPAEFGPYPAFAGALSHLKTDFHFSLPDNDSLGDLLKLLHPTPAVCGLPKEKAYQFILDHEDHERRYHSGFMVC